MSCIFSCWSGTPSGHRMEFFGAAENQGLATERRASNLSGFQLPKRLLHRHSVEEGVQDVPSTRWPSRADRDSRSSWFRPGFPGNRWGEHDASCCRFWEQTAENVRGQLWLSEKARDDRLHHGITVALLGCCDDNSKDSVTSRVIMFFCVSLFFRMNLRNLCKRSIRFVLNSFMRKVKFRTRELWQGVFFQKEFINGDVVKENTN